MSKDLKFVLQLAVAVGLFCFGTALIASYVKALRAQEIDTTWTALILEPGQSAEFAVVSDEPLTWRSEDPAVQIAQEPGYLRVSAVSGGIPLSYVVGVAESGREAVLLVSTTLDEYALPEPAFEAPLEQDQIGVSLRWVGGQAPGQPKKAKRIGAWGPPPDRNCRHGERKEVRSRDYGPPPINGAWKKKTLTVDSAVRGALLKIGFDFRIGSQLVYEEMSVWHFRAWYIDAWKCVNGQWEWQETTRCAQGGVRTFVKPAWAGKVVGPRGLDGVSWDEPPGCRRIARRGEQ